jgi:hypothetical protein
MLTIVVSATATKEAVASRPSIHRGFVSTPNSVGPVGVLHTQCVETPSEPDGRSTWRRYVGMCGHFHAGV